MAQNASSSDRSHARRNIITIALPLLLAAVANADEAYDSFYYVDLAKGRQCFDEVRSVRRLLNTVDRIKLGLPGMVEWTSARALTAVGYILMTEKLSLPVDVRTYASPDLYGLLRTAEADLFLEVWPELKQEERYNATTAICGYSPCVSGDQPLGFTGRSGWFVLYDSVSRTAPWNQCPGDEPCLIPAQWEYSNVLNEQVAQAALIDAEELPVTDLCDSFPFWTDGAEYGEYNCTLGQFVPYDRHCCARGESCTDENGDPITLFVPDIGNITKSPCKALLVPDPSYDSGFNERAVSRLRLRTLQIVYGNVSAGVDYSRREERPLITYWWEPHTLLLPVGSFVRISSISFLYCTAGESATWRGGSELCDFPEQAAVKAYNYKMTTNPEVLKLVTRMTVSYVQVMEMLVMQDAVDDDAWLAACQWLRTNPETWEDWLDPRDTYLGRLIIALCFSTIAFLYVFVIEPFEGAISRWFGRAPMLGQRRTPDFASGGADEAEVDLDEEMAHRLTKAVVAGPGELHVTLGQGTVFVRETDTWATVLLLRLGENIDEELEVDLETINGTAKFGRDYGELVPVGALQAGNMPEIQRHRKKKAKKKELKLALEAEDAQKKKVVFGRGIRTCMAQVRLLQAAGYDAVLTFFVRASLPHGCKAFVGPIATTKVRMINVDAYPNGFAFDMSTQQGSRWYGELKAHEQLHAAESYMSQSFQGEGSNVVSEGLKPERPSLRERIKHTYVEQRERWRAVGNFLIEAHRGNMKASLKYTLAQLVTAGIDYLAATSLKTVMINEGLNEGDNNAALFSALMMAGLEICKWRLTTVYHAGWPVQKRLQRILVRKYFSLNELDFLLNPHLSSQYRAAILESAFNLRDKGYAAFHGVIASGYQILFAVFYLIYQVQHSDGDQDMVRLLYATVFPIGFSALFVFQLYRGGRTWWLWRRVYDGQMSLYDAVAFALAHPNLVREAEKEDETMWKVEDAISTYLNAGFGLWLYNHFTASWARGALYLATYALWATGPYLTDPEHPVMAIGDFIVLLDVIAMLSSSVMQLQQKAIDVYTSGSIVIEISALLNYPTYAEKQLLLGTEPDDADLEPVLLGPSKHAPPTEDQLEAASATGRYTTSTVSHAATGWRHGSHQLSSDALDEVEELIRGEITEMKTTDAPRSSTRSVSLRSAPDVGGRSQQQKLSNTLSVPPSDERWLEEVRAIIATVSSDDHVFKVKDVCLKIKGREPTFAGLGLTEYPTDQAAAEGAVPRPVDMIPAGGIIGLRTSDDGEFGHLAEIFMMKMLAGSLKPQQGIACTLPALKVGFVSRRPELFEGNLLENLLYGVVPAAYIQDGVLIEPVPEDTIGTKDDTGDAAAVTVDVKPAEELVINDYQLWRLCKYVGINEAIIGKTYAPNSVWAQSYIDPAAATTLFSTADLEKVVLVRTLLRDPDVLLLYRVGGGILDISDQRRLIGLLRGFLDRSLDRLTQPRILDLGRKRLQRPRTVLLSAADVVLCAALKADEKVITLETPTAASIKSRSQTYPAETTKEWQAVWQLDSFQHRDHHDDDAHATRPHAPGVVSHDVLFPDHPGHRRKPEARTAPSAPNASSHEAPQPQHKRTDSAGGVASKWKPEGSRFPRIDSADELADTDDAPSAAAAPSTAAAPSSAAVVAEPDSSTPRVSSDVDDAEARADRVTFDLAEHNKLSEDDPWPASPST